MEKMDRGPSAETIAPLSTRSYAGRTASPRATFLADQSLSAKLDYQEKEYALPPPSSHTCSGPPVPRPQRSMTPGGSPLDSSQPAFPEYHRKHGNPSPLGLLGFAGTTFIISLYNLRAGGVHSNNVILGMAMFYGGLAQIIAGIQDWYGGNTFGATAFTSYGCYWLSTATLYIPQLGVAQAYETPEEYRAAVGIYLTSWAIITFIFLLACLRSSVALILNFLFLDLNYWCLVGGYLGDSPACFKAAGVFGLIAAAVAMYTALAGMLTKDTSNIIIPVGNLSRAST